MKGIILAGGAGTRLYPLTENFPKALLEVRGKTILDWLYDDICLSGTVDSFVVVSNHRYISHFEKWAAGKTELPVQVIDDGTESNETRLGAVRDVQFAIDALSLDDEMLVIAGDNLLDFSLVRFIDYARRKGTSAILRYYEPETARLSRCGVVEVDGEDRILTMEEKPKQPRSHWCCPPFYFYTREDARLVKRGIEAGCGVDAPGSYIAWLCGETAVHAMEMPGRRYDIGNLESYRQVQATYQGITR